MALRPVYSTRFLAFSADGTPPPYEVPTGYVAVVRDADIVSGGGAMINWYLEVTEGARFAVGQFTIESIQQALPWRGRQVVYAGEHIAFQADGPVDGMVSGYLLAEP